MKMRGKNMVITKGGCLGGVPLKGTHVIAEELRGGAALVIASLYASQERLLLRIAN